jgi:hypothetical protein
MNERRAFQFNNGDVVVSVLEKKSGMLRPVELPFGNPEMDPKSGDIRPIRAVMNLGIEIEGRPGEYPDDLQQSVEIRVRYSADDQAAADRLNKPLVLAYWDGKAWIRFTAEKHGFRLEPDAVPHKGGFGVITITRWGDPPIIWGT